MGRAFIFVSLLTVQTHRVDLAPTQQCIHSSPVGGDTGLFIPAGSSPNGVPVSLDSNEAPKKDAKTGASIATAPLSTPPCDAISSQQLHSTPLCDVLSIATAPLYSTLRCDGKPIAPHRYEEHRNRNWGCRRRAICHVLRPLA